MPHKLILGITSLLTVFFLVVSVPSALGADDHPAVPLEQAIQTVRQNFVIPTAFSDFSSGFSQSDSTQVWSLVWNAADDSGGSFSAQVNAVTGEVISMNTWQSQPGGSNRIPTVSWAEAKATASGLLQRLVPNRFPHLVMISDAEPELISPSGISSYTVNWRRMVNQIPVEGVGAWITVNAVSGQVEGYSLNWSDLPMPDPSGIIAPAAAGQSFVNHQMIQLQYQMPEQYRPYNSQTSTSPLLVYLLDHPSNGVIDAFTGQPLEPDMELRITGGGGYGGMEDQAARLSLTPEESAEIVDIAGLISQEQAAATILKWAQPDSQLELESASLGKDWRDPQQRIWSISWVSSSGPDPGSYQYLYGRVDARTDELLGFSLSLPSAESKPTLSQQSAQKLGEDLLRKLQGERYEQFRLDADSLAPYPTGKTMPESEPSIWSFKFIRIANGIDFPGNGADIVVDRIHQKIISYNLNWFYGDLPASQGILGTEKATQIYLQSAPLTLTYAAFYSPDKRDSEMRLVYMPQVPDGKPSFRMIEAHKGTLLDYQGQPIAPTRQVKSYNDVAGNFAEKEILLLARSGLMTEYGDSFHPGEKVKLAALLRPLLASRQSLDAVRALSDDEVVKRAVSLGWLKESQPSDSVVSRGQLAQILVRSLDLEYLARLWEIYKLPYRDTASLSNDLRGYAALCWGLNIIKADGVNFDAGHTISRAEAASALVRSLNVQR